MEQKKTLWIIAAAGVFLLVVLAAAGIMYSPAKNQEQAVKTATVYNNGGNSDFGNGSGWVNLQENDDSYNKILPPVAEKKDLYVFTDNATVYELADKNKNGSDNSSNVFENSADSEKVNNSETIDLNLLKKELINEQAKQQNINITVNVPSEKENGNNASSALNIGVDGKKDLASAEIKQKSDGTDYYVAKKDSQSSDVKKTQTAEKSSGNKTASSTKTKPAVKSENKSANAVSVPQETVKYWVQVASYSNKKGSENARAILDSNKIPADIFTYVDNKDNLFFRVRVGPYTTKSEAEYWKTKINKIDEFSKAESYVTSTKS